MNILVIIATINRSNDSFLELMNIKKNYLVINQNSSNSGFNYLNIKNNSRLISLDYYGLSKSRNFGIYNSKGDITVIADDDLIYSNNFEEIIREAYLNNPKYDIICFKVPSINIERPKIYYPKRRELGFISSMKVTSYEITFKTKSVVGNNIYFDEKFGAGSNFFYNGEENIFLYDCLKKGLKILYLPTIIATVKHDSSTWFKGYNLKFYFDKGAMFHRMSSSFFLVNLFQFSIRKAKLSSKKFSVCSIFYIMFRGALFHFYLSQKRLKILK